VSKQFKVKICRTCSVVFQPTGPSAKFCSKKCRLGTAFCESCSTEFIKRHTQGLKDAKDNKYCSYVCRWQAVRSRDEYGRYLNSEGYIVLNKNYSKKPPSRGLNDNGYVRINLRKEGRVLEHRYVMEQALGRELHPDETVHHINGVKTDNRLENLELWASKHPRGQRTDDLIAWALDILARYAPSELTTNSEAR
jgi:hypothetical protein